MTRAVYLSFGLYLISSQFNTSHATVIDFEIVPGGTPSDQLAISAQYQADYGVTFSLEGGGTPFLERRGTADFGHGFWNAEARTYDTEAAGFEGELGDYFLRFGTDTFSPAPGPTLIIAYDTPVSAASAQIWDIDAASSGPGLGTHEAWMITARDASGVTIDTLLSPIGIAETRLDSLNAKPWTWSFNHANADIHSIAIAFSGTADVVGLAFDNFSPSTAVIPIPAALWLFGSGLIGLVGIARRNRSREAPSGLRLRFLP